MSQVQFLVNGGNSERNLVDKDNVRNITRHHQHPCRKNLIFSRWWENNIEVYEGHWQADKAHGQGMQGASVLDFWRRERQICCSTLASSWNFLISLRSHLFSHLPRIFTTDEGPQGGGNDLRLWSLVHCSRNGASRDFKSGMGCWGTNMQMAPATKDNGKKTSSLLAGIAGWVLEGSTRWHCAHPQLFGGALDNVLRILHVKWRSNILWYILYIYIYYIQYYTDKTIYHDHFVGCSILAAWCRVCICECFSPAEARTGYRAVARW